MRTGLALTALVLSALGCRGAPDPAAWCSLTPPGSTVDASVPRTFWRDAKPIVDARCGRCHRAGGIGPFALASAEDFAVRIPSVRRAIEEGTMPPYLASPCCTEYQLGIGLTPTERETMLSWLAQGAPAGDPSTASDGGLPRVSGLSRTDVTLRMPEAYLPAPPRGTTDDNRCFVMQWPMDRPVFITGLDMEPGAREVVHHLVVGALSGADAETAERRDRDDPLPGFSCNGGLGGINNVTTLGGSLLGGDFPDGLGHRIEPGARILLNIHYSTAHHAPMADRTEVRFKVDESARRFEVMTLGNPAWLVGDAMRVRAGDPNATFFFQNRPTLYTGGNRVWLRNITAHMHEFATRQRVMIVRANGQRECLLEIPRWRFGWEQPYWFATPKVLDPQDELYLECQFDNSPAGQPVPGATPRDFAWGGNNQDMCVAFVAYTREAP